MSVDTIAVSVLLPSYNEEAMLRESTERTLDRLDASLSDDEYEVLVVENGSADDTPTIARRLSREYERVHVLEVPTAGRGHALEVGTATASGDVVTYFDVDLATDLAHLDELVDAIRVDGYHIATGSRWLPGSEASRPLRRAIPSWVFNALVQLLLGSKVRDHQCGFKAFDRDALADLVEQVDDDRWFWDTELLVRAQREEYDVLEFPVRWEPGPDSSVDLLHDSAAMGLKLLRCWWKL